jgi:hypothetical protein
MTKGEIILYTTDDGKANIRLIAENDSVWLNQAALAELFQTTKQNISLHVKNILSDGELAEGTTVKESLTVQTEGDRQVQRKISLYNLEMILAVGYRVSSPRGAQFRRWATSVLKEYLVKGFAMDDERLKNPGEHDYFDELGRIVVMYLDYAELQAKNRKTTTMAQWEEKLDAFLSFNERDVLANAGRVRAEVAERLALERYEEFDASRRERERIAADEADITEIEQIEKNLEKTNELP